MRIGLLADTHDRIPTIADFIARFAAGGVSIVMHAGDYCAPFSLAPFRDANMPLLGVFGRNDGDRQALEAKAAMGMGTEIYESPHSFELGGKSILLVHDIGEVNKRSVSSHDIVIHGCSHKPEKKSIGETLVINPGEACGWIHGTCMAAILDIESGEVETIKA